MKQGSISTVRDMVARSQKQLSSSNFTDIDAKYRSQQIQLHTNVMATSDLDKYHKARCPSNSSTGQQIWARAVLSSS